MDSTQSALQAPVNSSNTTSEEGNEAPKSLPDSLPTSNNVDSSATEPSSGHIGAFGTYMMQQEIQEGSTYSASQPRAHIRSRRKSSVAQGRGLVGGARAPTRISVQDLEGDMSGTIMINTPETLDDLLQLVASRFGYKQKWCKLFSRHGAVIEDITLLKDDDLLYSADGGDFPQQMRAAHTPGLGSAVTSGHQSSESKAGVLLENSLDRYDIWGWPRIGQIVGAHNVRQRLTLSWRTSASVGAVLLIVDIIAFIFPPTCGGRGLCTDEASEDARKFYFWCFGLATLAAMTCILVAATLTMQLNLLPTNSDVFWFLREYGNWLVGYPTTLLVFSVALTFGGILSAAVGVYHLPVDAWVMVALYLLLGAVLMGMSLTLSIRTWARVNGMRLGKVWPDDPYLSSQTTNQMGSMPQADGYSPTHVSNLVSNNTSASNEQINSHPFDPPSSEVSPSFPSTLPNFVSSASPTQTEGLESLTVIREMHKS